MVVDMKPERVKKRVDFIAAQREGDKDIRRNLVVQMRIRKPQELNHGKMNVPRVGFTVTKKCGSAVIRNRIRRRLKAAIHEIHTMLLPDADYIIIGRVAGYKSKFDVLREDLFKAISRLNSRARKNSHPFRA